MSTEPPNQDSQQRDDLMERARETRHELTCDGDLRAAKLVNDLMAERDALHQQVKETNESWRQWLRFIFLIGKTSEDIAVMSDDQLRKAVCKQCDEETESLRAELAETEREYQALRESL